MIKQISILTLILILLVGCCDTECYEDKGGIQPDNTKTEYHIELETE